MNETDFLNLSQSYRHIALFRELPADHLSPIQAFSAMQGHCLLESAAETKQGRHSFIGAQPMATFSDPETGYEALKAFRRSFNCFCDHPLALYTGGLIGFVSYHAISLKESIPDRHRTQKEMPDLFFNCYRVSIVFDHAAGRLVLSSIVEIGADPAEDYRRANQELDVLEEKLNRPIALEPLKKKTKSVVEEDLDDVTFGRLVEKAKRSILAGDVFQVVLSRTFSTPCPEGSALDVYRVLRQNNPAPYLFYFDLGSYQIAGASPEKLISVKEGIVETVPIAGTRPIDGDPEELLSDPKEISEHMMLIDLARNDLGVVCEPGSVEVKEFKKVYPFSHVMHIVSRVQGKLCPGLDGLDAFQAAFPAGTVSGAPKIRAMEIIDELEISRRGLYGGAIVAIDVAGNLDSCIAIRMGMIKEGTAFVRAGAGIVFDSDPLAEAKETRYKATSLLEIL